MNQATLITKHMDDGLTEDQINERRNLIELNKILTPEERKFTIVLKQSDDYVQCPPSTSNYWVFFYRSKEQTTGSSRRYAGQCKFCLKSGINGRLESLRQHVLKCERLTDVVKRKYLDYAQGLYDDEFSKKNRRTISKKNTALNHAAQRQLTIDSIFEDSDDVISNKRKLIKSSDVLLSGSNSKKQKIKDIDVDMNNPLHIAINYLQNLDEFKDGKDDETLFSLSDYLELNPSALGLFFTFKEDKRLGWLKRKVGIS
ncbi:hypothetical protein HK099_008178 [Clydaea vesicula]|uniref:Uncharacterized protein n=1 Tax=Clydaea vesicula TaxID=447962 RepID=A0AAD5TY51_9FUNG|nr:hypothetical protein HK099_008178 [Clydaea vesicula]